MCLILTSWLQQPDTPLIVAANRDEFYARPTRSAHFWPSHPALLAGRDLEFGGSWLGVNTAGQFAAITNLRNVEASGELSRGDIVREFLTGGQSGTDFFDALERRKRRYRPFNFLACDGHSLLYCNNIQRGWQVLPPAIYAIGNFPLSEAHRKTRKACQAMQDLGAGIADPARLMRLLENETPALKTGDEREIALSGRFIRGSEYGTRCSTTVICHRNGSIDFRERQHDARHKNLGETHFEFDRV